MSLKEYLQVLRQRFSGRAPRTSSKDVLPTGLRKAFQALRKFRSELKLSKPSLQAFSDNLSSSPRTDFERFDVEPEDGPRVLFKHGNVAFGNFRRHAA